MLKFSIFLVLVLSLFLNQTRGLIYEYRSIINGTVVNGPTNLFAVEFGVVFLDNHKYREISLNAVGRKGHYVIFFGTDSHRPLQNSCSKQCKVLLRKRSTGETSASLRAGVQIFNPPPSAVGVLQLCIGPVNMFWKRPLINQEAISCMVWKLSPLQKYGAQRAGGNIVQPSPDMVDTCRIEMHTWYMSAVNYDEMRAGNLTEVLIPMFEKLYWLPIVTSFFHGGHHHNMKCYFKAPFHNRLVSDSPRTVKTEYTMIYRYTNYIETIEENSGIYNVSCTARDWDEFSKIHWPVEYNTSLKITFFKGLRLIIEGYSLNTVVLTNTNTFNIKLYSTSPVSVFKVEASDGPGMGGNPVLTQTLAQTAFSLLSEHKMEIPSAVVGMKSTYTMTAMNEDQESITQNVVVIKPKKMRVMARPQKIEVEEGDKVMFDCTVTGDFIQDIQWSRDYSPLENESFQIDDTSASNHSRVLRMTIHSATKDHAGNYLCTVTDLIETRRATVNLLVYPEGISLTVDETADDQQKESSAPPSLFLQPTTTHHLNISQSDLLAELVWHFPTRQMSPSSIVIIVLALLAGAITLAACIAAGAYYIYQLTSPAEDTEPGIPKIQTTEELWETLRQHSVQMDEMPLLKATGSTHNDGDGEFDENQFNEEAANDETDLVKEATKDEADLVKRVTKGESNLMEETANNEIKEGVEIANNKTKMVNEVPNNNEDCQRPAEEATTKTKHKQKKSKQRRDHTEPGAHHQEAKRVRKRNLKGKHKQSELWTQKEGLTEPSIHLLQPQENYRAKSDWETEGETKDRHVEQSEGVALPREELIVEHEKLQSPDAKSESPRTKSKCQKPKHKQSDSPKPKHKQSDSPKTKHKELESPKPKHKELESHKMDKKSKHSSSS